MQIKNPSGLLSFRRVPHALAVLGCYPRARKLQLKSALCDGCYASQRECQAHLFVQIFAGDPMLPDGIANRSIDLNTIFINALTGRNPRQGWYRVKVERNKQETCHSESDAG